MKLNKDEYFTARRAFEQGNSSIDYAVRNIYVGDDEQSHVVEEAKNTNAIEWYNLWRPQIAYVDIGKMLYVIVTKSITWEIVVDQILSPHISNALLFKFDFETWEAVLLEDTYEVYLEVIGEN